MLRPSHYRPNAFTLIELTAVVALTAAAGALGTVLMSPSAAPPAGGAGRQATPPSDPGRSPRDAARQSRDAAQVRTFVQAMVVFGNNNEDQFPLPSRLDFRNRTVAERGRAKDTTANIVSILIFGGLVSTDGCVSPAEVNRSIRRHRSYQFSDPEAAVEPADALWDPAFAVDFTDGKTGHLSYAHLQPAGGRLDHWTVSFDTVQPVFGSRGPELTEAVHDDGEVTGGKIKIENSNTLRFWQPHDAWQGNIGYADGHVTFTKGLIPTDIEERRKWRRYTTKEDKKVLDLYFLDEPDDTDSSNAFLGIFTKAGSTPADYKAIWD